MWIMFSNSIILLTNIFCSKDVSLYPDYVTLYKQVDITVQYWDNQLSRQNKYSPEFENHKWYAEYLKAHIM